MLLFIYFVFIEANITEQNNRTEQSSLVPEPLFGKLGSRMIYINLYLLAKSDFKTKTKKINK